MQLPNKKQLDEFVKLGAEPPSHEEHDTEDSWEHPLSEKLIQAKCWNWRLEGNLLYCDSDFGPIAQTIPSDYIMTGVDTSGLPQFKKLIL